MMHNKLSNFHFQGWRWLADLSLISIAAVWGATFFMVKDVTRSYPVLAFIAIRFMLSCLVLLPFVRRLPTRDETKWGILAGLALGGGYIFQTFALRLDDSGRVGFLTGLYVILVPLLAWLLLRHRLKGHILLAAGLALAGLTLLSYVAGGTPSGDGLALLCALSFAIQIIAVEKFPKIDCDWRLMVFMESACVVILSGLLAPLIEPLPTSLPLDVFAVAALTGIVASAIGFGIQVWAQRILPPSEAALIFALESPFAALFGILFLAEAFTLKTLIGCGLILAGMLLTTLKSAG